MSLDTLGKREYLNIRAFYQKETDWLPGKQGLALPISQFGELVNAVQKAGEMLGRSP